MGVQAASVVFLFGLVELRRQSHCGQTCPPRLFTFIHAPTPETKQRARPPSGLGPPGGLGHGALSATAAVLGGGGGANGPQLLITLPLSQTEECDFQSPPPLRPSAQG